MAQLPETTLLLIDTHKLLYTPVFSDFFDEYRDGSHTEEYCGDLYWRNQNDKLHRDGDKPAIIGADGRLVWYQNGQRHRSRGPARIYSDGTLEWWINGENITDEVNEWLDEEEWRGTPLQIFEFQLRFI